MNKGDEDFIYLLIFVFIVPSIIMMSGVFFAKYYTPEDFWFAIVIIILNSALLTFFVYKILAIEKRIKKREHWENS